MGLTKQAEETGGGRRAGGIDAAGLARAAVGRLAGGPGGALGGLRGLRHAFERAGLGAAFDSWVGTGPNRPLSAGELEAALGRTTIGELARAAGTEPGRVAEALAELLPRVIDELTPAGALPDEAAAGAAAGRPALGR